ncbi:MAG: hypothetical protein ACPL1Z_07070 [Candidatus Bathyarchaeales archaeon]
MGIVKRRRKTRLKEKTRLWEVAIWIFGLVIGTVLGIVFDAYLRPILMPMIAEKPELLIKVFQSHAPYQNQSYVEYVIMIQQNMSKAKSTTLENIYLVFDFNSAILSVREEKIEGITNPSIRVGGGVLIVGDGQVLPDVIKYCELIVDIESLKPNGFCAISVIVNPNYEGSLARSHIVPNPTRRYFGSFEYDASGVKVRKEVSGDIPEPSY